jgi:phosphoribosylamine--glycine ligase
MSQENGKHPTEHNNERLTKDSLVQKYNHLLDQNNNEQIEKPLETTNGNGKHTNNPHKFLFVSNDAVLGDLAWRVLKEGNEVKYYVGNPLMKDVNDGFMPKSENWQEDTDWADIIIFDDVIYGYKANELRAQGKAVIGGTPYTDMLEEERSFGQEELKKVGVPIIPYRHFNNFPEAIEYVKTNPGRYVIKPSGEAQGNKGLLFIGEEEDGRDVIQVLEDYHQAWSHKITSFQLQKRVVGVEVAVGAFFNGNEFMYPININFEHKKLFPGNLGPSTGEMGTSMFWSNRNKLFNQTLKKMESKLTEEKYTGYIDLNCIVNGNGIYPLEFTSRFGFPTISIQQEGINNLLSDFLYGMATGTMNQFKTKSGFQVGVEIVVPPFPFEDPETFRVQSKDNVIHFNKPNKDGIHIEDIKIVNGEWVVAGNTGIVMTVCGTGSTMKAAKQQAYQRIKNIVIPHMYYRTDISDRWYEDSDKLHNWGYLREFY